MTSGLSTYGGALGGAAAAGAVQGSMAGVGAGAGASAGMSMMAGPAAIAAVAYIVGSGIYGHFKSGQQRTKDNKASDRILTGLMQGTHIDDPTGGDLGKGREYMSDGHKFFLPDRYWQAQSERLGGDDTHRTLGSTESKQFSAASYWNPEKNEWEEGYFGGAVGEGAFQSNTWRPMDGSGWGTEDNKLGSSYADVDAGYAETLQGISSRASLRDKAASSGQTAAQVEGLGTYDHGDGMGQNNWATYGRGNRYIQEGTSPNAALAKKAQTEYEKRSGKTDAFTPGGGIGSYQYNDTTYTVQGAGERGN